MTVVGRPGRHDSGPGLVCALGFAALGQVGCLGPYLVVAAAHPSSALLAGPLTRTMLLPGAGDDERAMGSTSDTGDVPAV
jgi:hypothetical protein